MPRFSACFPNIIWRKLVNGRAARSLCTLLVQRLCAGWMNEAAIKIEGLSKVYAGGKQALSDVSLDVPRGQIFGLLGPNGAGKSTLINILAGLVNKSGGTASIWGFDIDRHPRNAKYSIGIVPGDTLRPLLYAGRDP